MADDTKYTLETARADRSVWLMKCPTVVAETWQAATAAGGSSSSSDPNPVVAKVIVSLDPLSNESSVKFKMELAPQADSGNKPKSYSLKMFKDFVPMSVFSESNQGKVSLEGKVEHKFDMEPHSENFRDYGKLCRQRTQQCVKTRKVQVLENDHGMGLRPMPGQLGLMPSGSKEKKKPTLTKPSDTKRTRRDRSELVNIIFKLFEKQPNWALKQLVIETDQPEQFLKEILNELCVYNKRGPNQGTHELKPEYRKSAEDVDAS